jgi:cobalt-zinc-cadmium efflux system membrane fusion protein
MRSTKCVVVGICALLFATFVPRPSSSIADQPEGSTPDDAPSKDGKVEISDEQRSAAGIEVGMCTKHLMPELVRTTGTMEPNADEVAHIGARLPGTAVDVTEKGALGIDVEKGDVLAWVDSLEFGKAQTDFLKARAVLDLREKSRDRERALVERKISSGRELQEAESEFAQARIDLDAARNQLTVLGLPGEDIDAIGSGKMPLGRMAIRAPIAGRVVEKHVVRGEHVDTESNLFTLANLCCVWVFADIYERDLGRIANGQSAEVVVAAFPGEVFAGKIGHVADFMDQETRTLKVRVELDSCKGKLKPGMFATIEIAVSEKAEALAVPEAALQSDHQVEMVFVEESHGVFQRRQVRTGVRFGGHVEILDGLVEGDRVATSGSFLLKSELEKESFGDE